MPGSGSIFAKARDMSGGWRDARPGTASRDEAGSVPPTRIPAPQGMSPGRPHTPLAADHAHVPKPHSGAAAPTRKLFRADLAQGTGRGDCASFSAAAAHGTHPSVAAAADAGAATPSAAAPSAASLKPAPRAHTHPPERSHAATACACGDSGPWSADPAAAAAGAQRMAGACPGGGRGPGAVGAPGAAGAGGFRAPPGKAAATAAAGPRRSSLDEVLEEMAGPDSAVEGQGGVADDAARAAAGKEHMGSGSAYAHQGDFESAATEFARAYVVGRKTAALVSLVNMRLRLGDFVFAHAVYTHLLANERACAELRAAELAKLRRKAADVCYQMVEVLIVDVVAPLEGQPPASEAAEEELLAAADAQRAAGDVALASQLLGQAFRLQLRAHRAELAEQIADEGAASARAHDAAGIGARSLPLTALLGSLEGFVGDGGDSTRALFAWAALAFLLESDLAAGYAPALAVRERALAHGRAAVDLALAAQEAHTSELTGPALVSHLLEEGLRANQVGDYAKAAAHFAAAYRLDHKAAQLISWANMQPKIKATRAVPVPASPGPGGDVVALTGTGQVVAACTYAFIAESRMQLNSREASLVKRKAADVERAMASSLARHGLGTARGAMPSLLALACMRRGQIGRRAAGGDALSGRSSRRLSGVSSARLTDPGETLDGEGGAMAQALMQSLLLERSRRALLESRVKELTHKLEEQRRMREAREKDQEKYQRRSRATRSSIGRTSEAEARPPPPLTGGIAEVPAEDGAPAETAEVEVGSLDTSPGAGTAGGGDGDGRGPGDAPAMGMPAWLGLLDHRADEGSEVAAGDGRSGVGGSGPSKKAVRSRRGSDVGGGVSKVDGPGFPLLYAFPPNTSPEGSAEAPGQAHDRGRGVRQSVTGPVLGVLGMIVCVPELGGSKERLKTQLAMLANAGFIALAFDGRDHGERHAPGTRPATEGWQESQKQYFWPLLVGTAHDIIATIEWSRYTWPGWSTLSVGVLGDSMGGDAALIASQIDENISAVIALRATPDWLRPGSVGNLLGEDEDGDELYRSYCPAANPKAYAHTPAICFICGANDRHVPKDAAITFAKELHRDTYRDCPERAQVVELDSGGWHGHMFSRDAIPKVQSAMLLWFKRHLDSLGFLPALRQASSPADMTLHC